MVDDVEEDEDEVVEVVVMVGGGGTTLIRPNNNERAPIGETEKRSELDRRIDTISKERYDAISCLFSFYKCLF